MPDPERKPREGYGPYVRWREATPEERDYLWQFWIVVGGGLFAAGLVLRMLGVA